MIRLIDISPPMSATSPTFPGDEPFSLRAERSASPEGTVSVSVVTSSVHNGAHVDAPLHVFAEGDDIASLSLECFVGTCFTADLSTSIASWKVPIRFEELPADFFEDAACTRVCCERLLIKTRSRLPEGWSGRFRTIDPDAVRRLVAAGVRLIGVDVPSIDPVESEALPAHRAALSYGVPILENLNLCGVDSGFYELMAFPMNWPGAEASPVRAVLRTLDAPTAARPTIPD